MHRVAVFLLIASPVHADAFVTTRVIKPGQVIAAADIAQIEATIDGALAEANQIVDQEARVTLYPGKPIQTGQVGPPALVQRNQVIVLSYTDAGLFISTEGRALARGRAGDLIPVLNLASRNTVQGRVMPDGTVLVSRTEG